MVENRKMNGFEIRFLSGFHINDEDKQIILKYREDFPIIEIHPLKDDTQFIYYVYYGCEKRVMFGGIDESSIFLTELEHKALKILKERGESAFYESLVPSVIKKWSEKTGVGFERQGEWFFTPLKLESRHDFLRLSLHILRYHPKKARNGLKKSDFSVFKYDKSLLNTNHRLKVLPDEEKYQIIEFPWEMFIILGTLVAPNHTKIILKEPYLLSRSNYLKTTD